MKQLSISPMKSNSTMESSEVYKRYLDAKKRFDEDLWASKKTFHKELSEIQQSYISSLYTFKEGDVVIIKNRYYDKPTLIVIEAVFFENNGNYEAEESYRHPIILVSGHMVDEDGYDKTYFPNSTQTIGVTCHAKDVTEITFIRHKGLRGR